jgi:hypothetical protein
MTTINQLPLQTGLAPGDQFAVWTPNNGDTRRVPFSVVQAAIFGSVPQTSDSLPGTLLNKLFNLGDNTLRGTFAQFNLACIDADFSTTNGIETLRNKTISLCSNTLRGTKAQWEDVVDDDALVFASDLGPLATAEGPLSVDLGGTGGITAAAARTSLGAAASGANTDITALDQDVVVTATGTIAANSIGYRGLPQETKTAAYVLALGDAGKQISITTGGVTIPANSAVAFPIGTTIVVYNDSGATQAIAITTDTLRLAGTATTGPRTLAQYGVATLIKVTATTWLAMGNVS